MADANPKPLPLDGGDPPNESNKTVSDSASAIAAGGSPPSKHPNESSDSNENEIEDTATSKPKNEEIKEVEIDNIDIMNEILEYRNRKGGCPGNNPDDFRRFCYPYIFLGIGNARGWIKKMKEIKNKFNSESAPMEEVDKNEFDLWKKIWGNE
ncbi:hypothetical protein Lser_V15G45233 [Lactuca serriola]